MSNRQNKLNSEIQERYKLIRAFHTCYYTQLSNDMAQMAIEFFFLVEDIFEGKQIDESNLRHVDLQRIKAFLKEDK